MLRQHEQPPAAGDSQDLRHGTVVLGADVAPDAPALATWRERGVTASDRHVGLGQDHLGVVQQAGEEGPGEVQRALRLEARKPKRENTFPPGAR
jgi:hypothetical protein